MNKTAGSEAKIIEEVAEWLVLMGEKPLDEATLEKFEEWKRQSASHQKAWDKAALLQKRLANIPHDVSKKTFSQIRKKRMQLHKLVFICVIGSGIFGVVYVGQQQAWLADYRTAYGEQKEVILEDGTRIALNSKTAIDIDFTSKQRKIVLHYGEIFIQTAHSSDRYSQPLFVASQYGTVQSLGTQFDVEQLNRSTAVSVLEHAVKVTSANTQDVHILSSGKQLEFNADHISDESAISMTRFMWRSGLIVANRMPLQEFASQIKKYYGVEVIVDEASKAIPISGTYPVNNLSDLLSSLKQTYHLQIDKTWLNYKISKQSSS